MTAFKVETKTLTDFAGVLYVGGHAIDLNQAFSSTAHTYVSNFVPVPHDPGDLYSEIYKNNVKVVEALKQDMLDIAQLCTMSGINLDSCAGEYDKRDDTANADIDAKYPGGTPGTIEPGSGVNVAAKLSDPVPLLAGTPSTSAPIPDMAWWIMDKAGWVSITGAALKIASLFGLDPVGDLTKAVVGDYGELAQAGHAVQQLAVFERAAADILGTGAASMVWTGNAGTGAKSYFNEFANALETHAGKLDELGTKYELLVQHCSTIATALSGLLATAIDEILICVAELAAAGCLASVPGINVIIGLIGAFQVWKTKEAVAAFVTIVGNVFYGIEGTVAAVTGIASIFHGGSVDGTFPAAPYSYPK